MTDEERREYMRRWRLNRTPYQREHDRAYQRQWYLDHRKPLTEERKQRMRDRFRAATDTPEKREAYNSAARTRRQAYWAAHPEKHEAYKAHMREYMRRYRDAKRATDRRAESACVDGARLRG